MGEKYDITYQDVVRAIEQNGGTATTTEARKETGLDNQQVRYRFNRLEQDGLVKLDKDPEKTPSRVAPVTVATLTEDGWAKVSEGFTFEPKMNRANIEPQDNADRLDDLEELVRQLKREKQELQEKLSEVRENQNWIGPRVEEHEEILKDRN